MCEQTKRYFCPRLVDYVIIVGCRHPNEYNHITQTPELLRRYPLEDHKDFALPPDVIFFCQPEGCINTGHQRTGFQQLTSFVFTLTEKDSNRQRFGICVNFYRHFSRRSCSIHSHNQQKTDCNDSSDEGPGLNSHLTVTQEQTDGTDSNERKRRRRLRNNTLTSICLISHHPFFTRFRECLTTLKHIIDACDERSSAKRTGASRGISRETVWDILTGQVCECTSNIVGREVREIETWMLRLLSAPVSIPGKTKVSINILPNEPPMLFALPDHTRFSLVDFPLHLPLELLGVDLCIRVLTLIMLENKVVFQSRDYNALTMSVLAFVALLYPLEYMFPVIPLLPTCMTGAEQLLLIPTPFIIGVPASFFPYKGMGSKKFDDIWIVDLDTNQIVPPRHAEPFFDIPEFEYYILSNHLKQALGSMSVDREPIQNFDTISNDKFDTTDSKPLSSTATNPFIYGTDVDSVDIATRVAMVRFFNSPNILGHFNEYTRTLRLHPRAVVAFQYSCFVRSRPVKSAFIIRLAKTQAVEFFAEWSLCPDNVAFLRVQTGVYDPALIGDKAKWYSQDLRSIPFNVVQENSTLGQALNSLNAKSHDIEQTPTDESGSDSDEEDSSNSCYSSLSDFVYEMRNSGICGEIRENKIYPENQEKTACVEYATVFSPPEQLQIPPNPNKVSSMTDSTLSVNSNSDETSKFDSPMEGSYRIAPDLSGIRMNTDSISSSAAITPVTKNLPKTSQNEENSVQPTLSESSIEIHINNEKQSNQSSENNAHLSPSLFEQMGDDINAAMAGRAVTNIAKLATNKVSELLTFSDYPIKIIPSNANHSSFVTKPNQPTENSNVIKYIGRNFSSIVVDRPREFFRQQSVELKANTHSENQLFLNEIVTGVLDGSGIGWLKINRVKKLMEDENYRNFVLGRLNVSLNRRYSDEDAHIDDVKVSRAVFKGMVNILRAVIQGLEATFENNGVGGMASIFQLLEIAHTHYWIKDSTIRSDLSPMSERNSPLVSSRESLASIDPNVPVNSTNLSSNVPFQEKPNELTSPAASLAAQLGNFWRESKSALSRSFASATQATAALTPSFDSLLNSQHSFTPHVPHSSTHTVNSSTPSDFHSNEHLLLNQTPSMLNHNDIEQKIDQIEVDGDEFQNIEIVPDPIFNSMETSTVEVNTSNLNGTTIDNQIRPNSLNLIIERKSKTYISISGVNSAATSDEENGVDSASSTRRESKIDQDPRRLSTILTEDRLKNEHTLLLSTVKSSLSTGYRFRNGSLIEITGNNTVSINDKQYIFEVLVGSARSHLWDQMQIWEDMFLDAIAQERDIIGLDQGPAEMMERYYSLSQTDRRRLELDEDRLLAVLLYNLIAFMVMMRVSKDEIRRKVRRMLGRCHIGLSMSQQVNELIDNIANLNGNDIDLRPATSRLLQKQSFTVHWGVDSSGDMFFMEVWDDCIILRSVLGEVYDRCWFEKLVNMTFCPKTKVICLWRKTDTETQLNKFYTKRCRDLYFSIKESMERAVSRVKGVLPDQEFGGEFPIKNLINGEGGLLKVCLEGIWLTFENDKKLIDLQKIRKCTTQKGDTFVLEEFDPNTKQMLTRKYKSSMANKILLAFHRVVSIVLERRKISAVNDAFNETNRNLQQITNELVQARSIASLKSDERIETFRKHDDNGFHSEKYYKFLRRLLNHRMNAYSEDNDDLSSRTIGDASVLMKRGSFLFPSRTSIKRYRPTHIYGRKSHWDTFFG
ncbi:unnamed protein product [Rotaria magnacalcarata]|uniref:MAP kinase-activating death domain protein n=4 Tax=Rotaria magnacalcarata TaxID=392030 RepID=A0A819P073_9BILA|nr:unnamed protein product [Rotaria magnacalcarata]